MFFKYEYYMTNIPIPINYQILIKFVKVKAWQTFIFIALVINYWFIMCSLCSSDTTDCKLNITQNLKENFATFHSNECNFRRVDFPRMYDLITPWNLLSPFAACTYYNGEMYSINLYTYEVVVRQWKMISARLSIRIHLEVVRIFIGLGTKNKPMGA